MQGTASLVQPSAAFRPYARAGAALLIVLIMLVSGSAMAFASGVNAAGSPTGGAPITPSAVVQTGEQLQHDSFLQNPGTPVSSLTNASILGNIAPNQTISFTVGFRHGIRGT